ncbi:MAG TPA: DUF6438 domain-containing protein [Steroidobacteraceae bacterium]|nr:DUF6438 domain-containing protein [Steroidobacteraceae bacterium]
MRAVVLILSLAVASIATVLAAAQTPTGQARYRGTPINLEGRVLDDSTVIALERGPCFGKCSQYSVAIYGSGRVEFNGRRYVCAPGHRTAQASVADVRSLLEQMLALGYLDFYWRPGSKPSLSDTVISSLNHDGYYRRVEHHIGDREAPLFLRELEERIDSVAGTWRWLPEREDDRRVCRREDGETTEVLEQYIPTR